MPASEITKQDGPPAHKTTARANTAFRLTDYEVQLIASVRKLPAQDRANVSRSITFFCIAAADGFQAGGYSEGATA